MTEIPPVSPDCSDKVSMWSPCLRSSPGFFGFVFGFFLILSNLFSVRGGGMGVGVTSSPWGHQEGGHEAQPILLCRSRVGPGHSDFNKKIPNKTTKKS